MTIIAVYGSLRKGLGNHPVISANGAEGKDYKFLGKGWTDEKYKMYSLHAYPFVTSTEQQSNIVVELYEVNDYIARRVDGLEGCNPSNPESDSNFYKRMQVDVTLESGDKHVAWMYFIDTREDTTAPPVVHGDWKHYLEQEA